MEQALITCIVPVYNGELYLREAIDSILEQSYRPLEIIMVDDGSTDGTADVAASYGDRLRYVRQANAGPAAARNHGLSLAQGEFVAFQDADDVWHPEKLARQMARLATRPELDLCVTHVQNFWVPELREEAKQFRHHRFSQPLPGYAIPTLLARRVLFGTVGRFNTALRLSSDTDWFLRAAEQGAVMELLPDVLMYRRLHQANISKQPGTPYMNSALPNDLLKVVKASLDRRRQSGGPRSLMSFPGWNQTEQ